MPEKGAEKETTKEEGAKERKRYSKSIEDLRLFTTFTIRKTKPKGVSSRGYQAKESGSMLFVIQDDINRPEMLFLEELNLALVLEVKERDKRVDFVFFGV